MFDSNATSAGKPAIVLIHGAWADSSCWNDVVVRLRAEGYPVYAPPNPLRSLATDAASIADFLKAIPGPVILVGHSYGGAVISVASAHAGNVKALVFIDAFVPDAGESCLALLSAYPAPPSDLFTPVPLASGDTDLYFSPKYFADGFATGVDRSVSAVLAVTQRPVTAGALGEPAPAELGWKTLALHRGDLINGLAEKLPPELATLVIDDGFDKTAMEACDAGLTECEALIAQTGSVCVTTRSSGGRTLSVLPPHHVVIAQKAQLVADLPAAFELLAEKYAGNYPSFISFISGPSRTGDIERILVLGAHGPKKLTVLLVP